MTILAQAEGTVAAATIASQSQPFPGSFDTNSLVADKGKGHKNPVPEPASWGFIMVAVALAVFSYVRFIRRHNRCACGRHHRG